MAKSDPVVDALARVDLFEGLSRADLKRIAATGKEIRFEAGEELTTQGQRPGRFFLLLDGEASVVVDGKELGRVGPGEYVGEIGLIDGHPRAATVVATAPVRTLSLTSWNFRPLLKEHPSMAMQVMVLLCRRLRAAEAQLTA